MPFRPLLQTLCEDHDFIRGAIFCDEEGERIERFCAHSDVSEFELDIAGASFASLIPSLTTHGCQKTALRIVFEQNVYWLQLLIEGYFLLVITQKGIGYDHAIRKDLQSLGLNIISHM